MITLNYDWKLAVEYAKKWVFGRNPNYYDFTSLGGDCTNFVSQCVYAGSKVMNYKKDFGWYYKSPSDRAPAWTGVNEFKRFILTNTDVGPFGKVVDMENLHVGDIILLGNNDQVFYHNTLVVDFENDIPLIACHTFDQYRKPITSHNAKSLLCIHVSGVNTY